MLAQVFGLPWVFIDIEFSGMLLNIRADKESIIGKHKFWNISTETF